MLHARLLLGCAHQSAASFNGHPPLGVNATVQRDRVCAADIRTTFQWAPTLGGECYTLLERLRRIGVTDRFNGHPPLGVNATRFFLLCLIVFPPLYGFNGHPPLGVNATKVILNGNCLQFIPVSMGTHPWG